MSMTIFPAAPGTYVLDRERGAATARKIPVVGFQHIQGGVVFPLCAINIGGLTLGRALLTPDGFVTDPAFGVVCGHVEEWMALTESKPYWLGSTDRAAAVFEDSVDQNIAEETATAPTKRIPDKPAGKPQEFINKTFWQFVGERGDIDYIFVVEGGSPAPAKNALGFKKIKRDEFTAEKKAGIAVVEDWQTGVVSETSEEEPDDDGSNLI